MGRNQKSGIIQHQLLPYGFEFIDLKYIKK